MTLRLSLVNQDRLPDGGRVRIEVKERGLDIGRDAHLDWTLPDPKRHVSGKHCEIRYQDGGYWLHDVSSNGTFVNGSPYKLDGPRRLRSGDQIGIGDYLIAVELEGPASEEGRRATIPAAAGADVWAPVGEAAPPDARDAFRARAQERPPADFLDFAAPPPAFAPSPGAPLAPEVEDWMSAPPRAAPDLPAPPTPRRPPPLGAPDRSGDVFARETNAAPSPLAGPTSASLLARIAEAAGMPATLFADRDPEAAAAEIGAALRATADGLHQILAARAEIKTAMRTSTRTMIRALENNPLKFSGATEEALGHMFGPRSRNYLDAVATIKSSFADLNKHQTLTFAAMQSALEAMFEDLAPERIDASIEADRGLGGLISSRKARLWDVFVERWRARSRRADGRLTEAFMTLFAQAYERLGETR